MQHTREEFLEYSKNFGCLDKDVFENDCNFIIYMLENCEISIPAENEFFVRVSCGHIFNPLIAKRVESLNKQIEEEGLQAGQDALAYTGLYDFGHTSCQWDNVISLGVYGLKKRAEEYMNKAHSAMRQDFHKIIVKVYDAALSFMQRVAVDAEKCGKTRMAEGLKNLCVHSPQNLFEAMQTTLVFYVLQHTVENTILRTFGRVDQLFYPFYIKEEKESAKKLIDDFMLESDALTVNANNIPFALGGTDINGESLVNELSYAFLNAYKRLDTPELKLHLLINDNTPEDFVRIGFECVRNGKNSIVFMSDKKIIESLIKIGAELKDATNYHVVGCYECGADEEVTCSCNAKVNIQKAVEYALNGGKDVLSGKQVGLENNGRFNSFGEFFDEFEKQLAYLCKCAMRVTDIYESCYNKIHAAPFFSSTYTHAMEKGGDIYCDYAAKYNNSSVNGVGLATATDSLAAIRKVVFEDKTMSLSEFNNVLKSNWQGKEELRLIIKNKFPKFGMGDSETDELAKKTVDILAREISGKPNKKGGVYRLGLFSINWRWEMGEKTCASADGRLSKETISQNSGATFGADRKGPTAHLLSTTVIDASNTPNGTVIDIDLHPSAVAGDDGLDAMMGVLKTYFKLGGFCVHYNVLSSDILKEAKMNPDKYRNLQVRLCGWNVFYNNLSDKEKDEFIKRAEAKL